jgi:hypothetical protein
MNQRLRKLIGTIALLALVICWALFAMALAQGRVGALSASGQVLAYLFLGLVWIVPAGALIWWMQRPGR